MGLDAGKEVKPGLEPGSKAVSDFEGFVDGVMGWEDAVDLVAFALDGEVAVDFDHGATDGNGVGGVDLDFVAVLGTGCEREEGSETSGTEETRNRRMMSAQHVGLSCGLVRMAISGSAAFTPLHEQRFKRSSAVAERFHIGR
jgi:hypothetical protein